MTARDNGNATTDASLNRYKFHDLGTNPIKENPMMTPVSKIKLYGILAGLTIATFLISLDVSIIATAIPAITSQFHATADIGRFGS
ncbi:hypothetical protein BBP40_010827 [Aspergillus hancockii]|nr:hypothetical protein BBP40_010827 [Aspergillus hancockii]